jgi:hypothetical protein
VLRLALLAAVLLALVAPDAAHAGQFTLNGGVITYTGAGNDSDQIAGFDTGDTIRFTRFGGADNLGGDPLCHVSLDNQTVDCEKAGVTAIVLDLGNGDDIAAIAANLRLPVIFKGGRGADGLFGGGGVDIFDGGDDNDNIIARDGRAEQVDCGSGNDTAITDDADTRTSCEEIEGDADGDGVRRPADCDDTRATIHPGAVDVPDNGIDEDCSGTDAVDADRDHDGTPRPQDCNDGDPSIRPGVAEVIGNDVDENCDGRADPFPPVIGSVSTAWTGAGRITRNVKLSLKKFARSTKIELRCSGGRCPFKVRRTTFGSRRTVSLNRFFKGRALRPGTRIELRLTVARRVGRVLRWTMRSPGGSPDVRFLCLPPGGRPGGC